MTDDIHSLFEISFEIMGQSKIKMAIEISGIILELPFQKTDRWVDLALLEILASADLLEISLGLTWGNSPNCAQ
jgi:hypothetical protein